MFSPTDRPRLQPNPPSPGDLVRAHLQVSSDKWGVHFGFIPSSKPSLVWHKSIRSLVMQTSSLRLLTRLSLGLFPGFWLAEDPSVPSRHSLSAAQVVIPAQQTPLYGGEVTSSKLTFVSCKLKPRLLEKPLHSFHPHQPFLSHQMS